jgi:hypothetical protein
MQIYVNTGILGCAAAAMLLSLHAQDAFLVCLQTFDACALGSPAHLPSIPVHEIKQFGVSLPALLASTCCMLMHNPTD